jgi:hypothetical protein
MMIKEKFFPEKNFVDQGDQKDQIRRIAGVDDIESMPAKNPGGKTKLPEKRTGILDQKSRR